MDRTERFYLIDKLLNERGVVAISTMLDELEISLATFKRDLTYMKDRLHAPIIWDRDAGGYRYEQPDRNLPVYSLPGLWFNAGEAHALLAMQQLLSNLEPGLLAGHVAPLQARLRALMGSGDQEPDEVEKRIKILHAAKREISLEFFSAVASATLKRRRIRVRHFNRGTKQATERTLSPQQLVHYRDNWYLDSYCHERNAIRSFSVDALQTVEVLDDPALNVRDEELKAVLESGYGIFAGKDVSWAKLKFSPERANWVSIEVWHPEQTSSYDEAGNYILKLPYSDDRELIMDILKQGPNVEVLEPDELRSKVKVAVSKMLAMY